MKRRILIADHELTVLLTLKALLESHGFEVEIAATSGQAIRRLQNAQFHMVITEVNLEHEKSGYEVLRVAKEQTYEPAVALLTAYPLLAADYSAHGAGTMLVKPIHANVLVRQIEAMLVSQEDRKQQHTVPLPPKSGSAPGKSATKRAV
ncbi:MAG: response regulator [Acidobacteriales bacterium]|nr:response regulator [Terriglobales bacterium]